MIGLEDRQEHAGDIEAARQAGARLHEACQVVALSRRCTGHLCSLADQFDDKSDKSVYHLIAAPSLGWELQGRICSSNINIDVRHCRAVDACSSEGLQTVDGSANCATRPDRRAVRVCSRYWLGGPHANEAFNLIA